MFQNGLRSPASRPVMEEYNVNDEQLIACPEGDKYADPDRMLARSQGEISC
jgi:hypothetical protein